MGIGLAALALGRAAHAQEDRMRVALRVTASAPGGVVVVDRGSLDGLRVGDRIELDARGGPDWIGAVVEVEPRSATVELELSQIEVPPGTRGRVWVPRERFDEPEEPEPAPLPAEGEAAEPEVGAEPDTGLEPWEPHMPLLAGLRSYAPDERPRRIRGWTELFLGGTWTSEEQREQSTARLGAHVDVENPFGRGGRLVLDGELENFSYQVPDEDEQTISRGRLQRLSYAWGGTRQDPTRIEVGRFLQHGVPEFGVLDGAEWSQRFDNGHRLGASVGFLPDPTEEYESGRDFQLATYYRWVSNLSEESSFTAGYQRSFRDGDADRDLFVLRGRTRLSDVWSLSGSAWVDLYTAGDVVAGSGLELTQALLRATRTFSDDSGLEFQYRRLVFPDTQQGGAQPFFLDPNQLANDRFDRFGVDAWRWLDPNRRLFGGMGYSTDEHGTNADSVLGLDWHDLWLDGGSLRTSLTASHGRFGPAGHLRLAYGRREGRSGWDVHYEYAYYEQQDFQSDLGLLPGQRLGATRDFDLGSDWHLSASGELVDYDGENAWTAALRLTRSF